MAGHKIKTLWAFVAVDPADPSGDEGIMAGRVNDHWMPFVGSDLKRVEDLAPIALAAAEQAGVALKLKRFKLVEEAQC